jgi:hypothetical protein
MKAATVHEIKQELTTRSQNELVSLCLHLAKFKKENKELLTYLLYEASNESSYVESIKLEMEEQFETINKSSYYFIKKSVRKILRITKKYIRYSKKTETQIELIIYFCTKLKEMSPSIKNNQPLLNLYKRELSATNKAIGTLHEDLQYDYEMKMEGLKI